MSAADDDLLARLNALKPSSVQIKPSAPSIDVETTRPHSVEDRLADRLKSLRAGSTPQASTTRRTGDDAEDLTSRVRDEVAAERDPIRDWQEQDGDDQTLDDLLADLGPDEQWNLAPDDPKNIQSLMKEAKDALPEEPEKEVAAEHDRNAQDLSDLPTFSNSDHPGKAGEDSKRTDDQEDEEQADDYVKRVLAELEVEKKHGPADDDEPGDKSNGHQAGASGDNIQLPSAPSTIPEPSDTSERQPPSYEDSELEARFSMLGLGGLNLPSTPTTKPSSSRPKVTAKLKPKSNLPTYTDDDIESWCCICNEDAEVKCLGCDGDLYCQTCWTEGHGIGPGQEKGHRAVQYNKKPPAAAA